MMMGVFSVKTDEPTMVPYIVVVDQAEGSLAVNMHACIHKQAEQMAHLCKAELRKMFSSGSKSLLDPSITPTSSRCELSHSSSYV